MKRIKVYLSIGYPTARQEDILELDDHTTDEDIEESVREWANNYIETWWDVITD